MKISRESRKQLRLANTSFILLFLVAVGLLQWLSRDYHLKFDWTKNNRNSLSEASIAAIKPLNKPVRVIAYTSQRLTDQQKLIGQFVEKYQKYKPDISVEFIDPDMEPDRVRQDNIQVDGEIILKYGDASEHLTKVTEEQFTNALTRLGHSGERWLVFLSGHGERSPDRNANFDISSWANQLRQRGFKTRQLNLAETPQIPANTTALVIAGPQARLLAGEVKTIAKFVEDGGHLLWLGDPGDLHGLDPLAEMLGLEFQKGVVIDPESQIITGNASAIVINSYSNHAIVKNFSNLTLFPTATAIRFKQDDGRKWVVTPFLDTRERSWLETGPLNAQVDFNKGSDLPGPLTIGVTLTRELKDNSEQRIVVIADGDFLSNTYLGNAGNLELGLSVTNWISRDDAFVSIPVQSAVDSSLNLSRTAQGTIAVTFLLLIPLAMIAGGIGIWWTRRER